LFEIRRIFIVEDGRECTLMRRRYEYQSNKMQYKDYVKEWECVEIIEIVNHEDSIIRNQRG